MPIPHVGSNYGSPIEQQIQLHQDRTGKEEEMEGSHEKGDALQLNL